MSLKSAGQRIIVMTMLSLLLAPRPARAQDAASIFTTLGKFAAGFNAGQVFFAPAGFIHSDVLQERGELQQVGFVLNNRNVNLTVGFDVLTGFAAKEESLELRASITALPTVSTSYGTTLAALGEVPLSGTLSFGAGLSQLQDARATLPQSPTDRAVKLTGSGYHVGAGLSLGVSFGNMAGYVENSMRYTRFPSLDWTDDKLFVPPAGWPASMDFWTGTLRIGLAIGLPK